MHTGRSQSKNSDSRFGLPRFVQCKRADIESSAKRQVRKTYSRADLHYAPGSSSTIKIGDNGAQRERCCTAVYALSGARRPCFGVVHCVADLGRASAALVLRAWHTNTEQGRLAVCRGRVRLISMGLTRMVVSV